MLLRSSSFGTVKHQSMTVNMTVMTQTWLVLPECEWGSDQERRIERI